MGAGEEMGISVEAKTTSIDESVGGLVWVRRRNGSWWPEQILGADELPKNSLASPRSGTPMKLLGREDASMSFFIKPTKWTFILISQGLNHSQGFTVLEKLEL